MSAIILELGSVVLHTTILYLFLILVLSLTGYRQAAELSATELVVIMLLGSSVETALIAGDTSLLAGLVSAATLLVANRILTYFQKRVPWLQRAFGGRAILLVHNGRILMGPMQQAGLTEDDVMEGLRLRGYAKLEQVQYAVLERDGTISVVPQPDAG